MKLFTKITWVFVLLGTFLSGYTILVSIKQSDILGSNNMTTAIAFAVIPFCFAYAVSKLIEEDEKE